MNTNLALKSDQLGGLPNSVNEAIVTPAFQRVPNYNDLAIEQVRVDFTNDLRDLFRGVRKLPGGKTGHMIRHDYLNVRTGRKNGGLDSSAALWDRVVRLGPTSGYTIPESEGLIIDRNTDYFSKLFPDGVTVCELGPGGNQAVQLKTLPVINALMDKAANDDTQYQYIALDLVETYAKGATTAVQGAYPQIKTKSIQGDFTEHHQLNITGPTLFMMWGLTLTQYPFGKNGEKTLGDVLSNFGSMIDYNGLLIATIDTNQFEAKARDTYTGEHFREFKLQLWRSAKKILESPHGNNIFIPGDNKDDPADAFIYAPRFEKERGGIVHSFITNKDVTCIIDGQNLSLAPGSTIDTGYSEKKTRREVENAITGTGWKVINELTDGASTVRALVLAGKNASPDLIRRAQLG